VGGIGGKREKIARFLNNSENTTEGVKEDSGPFTSFSCIQENFSEHFVWTEGRRQWQRSYQRMLYDSYYRGADTSLTRPGRKQARKHVTDARDFNNIETRTVITFLFLQSKAPKEIYAILTETLACFLPGRAKDLSVTINIRKTERKKYLWCKFQRIFGFEGLEWWFLILGTEVVDWGKKYAKKHCLQNQI